ncbi:MAG: TatD family hydrolase [Candidatus Micrarchaeia archaeon]
MYQSIYPMQERKIDLEKLDIQYSDAHCHLNLFENPEKVIDEARINGVNLIVASGASMKDNLEVSKIVKENVFGVVGIDPEHINENFRLEEIKNIIKGNRNIVGIGEIGLDRKIASAESYFEKEKEVFVKQLEIAEDMDLPVVIHSRGALEDIFQILGEFNIRAMFHFFEGDEKSVEKLGKNIISIPPVESNKRNRTIKKADIKSIVLETDSPIVGKSPKDVKNSAIIVSKVKGISIEKIAEATTENLRRFFYI